MKIVLVTLDFPPNLGGVGQYLYNIAKFFNKKIAVIAPPHKDDNEFDLQQNFKIYRESLLFNFFWPCHLKAIFKIKKFFNREEAEILAVNDVLPLGYAALFLKLFFKIPYFVFLHGFDFNLAKKNLWKKFWLKKILKNAEFVVCNSDWLGSEIKKLNSKIETLTVYPTINVKTSDVPRTSDVNMQKYELSGKKIIFSLGRLVARKGFDKLISAFEKIHTNRHKLENKPAQIANLSDIYLVIAGDGPEENYLRDLVKKSSCPKNIIFLGGISNEEKWAWFDLCDIFALPARKIKDDVEGFGIVYLEAACFGKPSIAGNVGGVSEAVIDGQTGILVNGENVEEIATAIIKLLKDDELRKRLGENAKRRALEEFNVEKQATKIKDKI